MINRLHKALAAGASLVVIASPSYATSVQSEAQLYGYINGETGSVKAGSVGISSVSHPQTGHYCIKPSSSSLQSALEADVANGTGYVDVNLTESGIQWPAIGRYITQVTGANVTKSEIGCSSDEIAVSIVQENNCTSLEPTSTTNPSLASCYDGYQSENSDFTIMFW